MNETTNKKEITNKNEISNRNEIANKNEISNKNKTKNTNRTYKIITDIVMTTGLLLLMSLATTGLMIHELLGIGIFLLFFFHKFLNRAWIVSVTKHIFRHADSKKPIPAKTKVTYILDFIILIFVTTTVLTGISISRELLPFLSALNKNIELWTPVHLASSYVSLILISIHLGLHWKYLMNLFKKMFRVYSGNAAQPVILRILAAGLVIIGIRYSMDKKISEILVAPFVNSKETQSEQYIQSTETVTKTTYLAAETTASDETTLEDYLGNLFCNGCHRHCSLLYPQCGRGVSQAEEATAEYEATVKDQGTTSESTSSENISENTTEDTTEDTTENSTEESSEIITENSSEESGDSKLPFSDTAIPFIPIMSIYIAGTHYTVSLLEKISKNAP